MPGVAQIRDHARLRIYLNQTSLIIQDDNAVLQDGIIVLDDQGCLIEINPQARVIANLRDARQGEKVDLSSFGLTDEMLDCGNPASHSYELTLPAPDERIIEVTCTLIVGSKRRGRGRLITLRDITERRKNEETIRQLFLAVEQSPTSVIITDPNGTIQYVNPIFCAITGYQFSEVIGRNPRGDFARLPQRTGSR